MMDLATVAAGGSRDRDTQVGCVIARDGNVLVAASNDVVDGAEATLERTTRPEKQVWIEHAERNAIYRAARRGINIDGATAYVTLFPCADCCRAMIQSGIRRVVSATAPDFDHPRWGQHFRHAVSLLDACEVTMCVISQTQKG